MNYVTVDVFITQDSVCTEGSERSVPTSSVPLYMEERNIVGDPRVLTYLNRNLSYMNLLKIRVPGIGDMWINSTLEGFEALVAAASQGPNDTDSLTYLIGTDADAGNFLIDQRLYNKKILSVTYNGVAVYNVAYTSNSLSNPKTGILDFTQAGTLTDLSTVQVTFKNA